MVENSSFFRSLLDSDVFMPHGHCYLWRPDILWLNVLSDAVIAGSYYAIPVFLVYFVWQRKDLAFNWIFVMFALFIVACGTTHLMEIWTVWNPNYGVQGLLKLFTAGISLATAFALVPLMPKALAFPGVGELKRNQLELRKLNEDLQQANALLEDRVAEKTRDLAGLAAIVKWSNDAILGNDKNGRITSWNPAAVRLFGATAEEAIGRHLYDFVPSDRRAEMDDIMAKISNGQTSKDFETIRLTKEGRLVDVSVTVSPLKDAHGNFVGSSSIIRDITDRRRSENILKKNEMIFRNVIEAAPSGLVMVNRDGKIVLCNAEIESLFGYTKEELVGQKIEILVPGRFRHGHPGFRQAFFDSPETRQMGQGRDLFGLRKDGQEVPVEIGLNPLETQEGSFVLASVVDITWRKTLEERFRKVIESAPNGLLMVDRQGKIVLCNKEFEALFGYQRSEIIGREMDFLVPERFRGSHPGHRSGFFQSPEARQMGAGRDLYGLRKDGLEFPVEIGLNPLQTDEGAFVLASIVDITKRKALETRIHRSATALQQKNQEMEQFVYTVSHDLKSPLVTSSGFLGLLKEDFLAKRYDKVMDSVARLERANSRMSQLINDLLQLSRVGRIQLEITSIDIAALVGGICENIAPQLQEKSVSVVIGQGMPRIRADHKRVYQVFENLIINALKYACDGTHPSIEIAGEETADEFRFVIKDKGPGIAKEYHQKIFGLFQRLESDNRGTGVGLTIVSRIMQTHGGRVWVESAVGEGASFWLAFPKVFTTQGESDDE